MSSCKSVLYSGIGNTLNRVGKHGVCRARALQQQSKELCPAPHPRSCWQRHEAGLCHWRKASRGCGFTGEGQRATHLPCRDCKSLEGSKNTALRRGHLPHRAQCFGAKTCWLHPASPPVPVSSPSAGRPLAHQAGKFANQKATALSLSVPKIPLLAPGTPSVSSRHTPKPAPKLYWMGEHHHKDKMH